MSGLSNRQVLGDRREIMTPEGVPLGFMLATRSARASAFLIDFGLQLIVIMVILCLAAILVRGADLVGAIVLVALFLTRHGYFLWFELRWQGVTPGKRRVGIRVIDRHGASLTAQAIIIRNVLRELEIWQPLVMLGMLLGELNLSGTDSNEGESFGYLLALLWVLIGAFMPFFNRDKLRLGDLAAGTMVVERSPVALLQDLSASNRRGARQAAEGYRFSREQLDVYGIYELHVLEQLLRRDVVEAWSAYSLVTEQIKTKIGWPRSEWEVNAEVFLRDFYRQQRGRLETQMLLGTRKEHKDQ